MGCQQYSSYHASDDPFMKDTRTLGFVSSVGLTSSKAADLRLQYFPATQSKASSLSQTVGKNGNEEMEARAGCVHCCGGRAASCCRDATMPWAPHLFRWYRDGASNIEARVQIQLVHIYINCVRMYTNMYIYMYIYTFVYIYVYICT